MALWAFASVVFTYKSPTCWWFTLVLIENGMLHMKMGLKLAALAVVASVMGAGSVYAEKKPARDVIAPAPRPIPPRPLPPLYSAPNLPIPPRGDDGVRQTVNTNISSAQTLWNLRSAYNVAALNCRDPQYKEIVVNYRAFLRKNARTLTAANRGVDKEFRGKYGAAFIKPRETYMTQVYNFYALPPVTPQFCDVVLPMSRASKKLTPKNFAKFAPEWLPQLNMVFEKFFDDYEVYLKAARAWDSQYLAPPTAVVPSSGAMGPRK